MSHAHLKVTHGFAAGSLTIDGERFPYPVQSISYRLNRKHELPTLIVEFDVDHLTIDHSVQYEPDTEAQTEADA